MSDICVVIGPRSVWGLIDDIVTKYLDICEKLGVKVGGKPVAEVRAELGRVKLINTNVGAAELATRIEHEVNNGR
jgi:hypothetical protein